MGFKFSERITKKDKSKITKALYKFHKDNQIIENENNARRATGLKLKKRRSAKDLILDLREQGLSYSEGSMRYDIRRAGATYNAKTPAARGRASKWFEEYFEPLRKQRKLSPKKAYKVWERAKTQSYENMSKAELEFALELREMGSP